MNPIENTDAPTASRVGGTPERETPRPAAPRAPARRSTGRVVAALLAIGILLGGAFLAGFVPRLHQSESLRLEVEDARTRVPEVKTVRVARAPARTTVSLPGTARAFLETPLYARINGYLKRFLVDIGDAVTKGQLIAEIESPEVDQQLRQARANLAVAKAALAQTRANLMLAQASAKRWETLAKDHAVSQQEADEKRAALLAREADVQSADAAILAQEAIVKRYEELQGFEQITAPFDGIVSARAVDVGTLVTEGSSTSARELFRVVQVHSLRLFVNVPEPAIPSIRPGLEVQVRFDAHPGRTWKGTVARTARSSDPSSRMMLTEVSVPNSDGVLSSGLYAQATFEIERATPPLIVPANALILWPKGTFVSRVSEEGTVHYPPVQVGRDYGSQAEILSGLREGDRVVVNPTTELKEGQKVSPVDEK
jgi:RND family efflux transporter MFP subunit